jgi:hypothetical protein
MVAGANLVAITEQFEDCFLCLLNRAHCSYPRVMADSFRRSTVYAAVFVGGLILCVGQYGKRVPSVISPARCSGAGAAG